MQIIDGKSISKQILDKLKTQIAKLPDHQCPALAVILVGDDSASRLYVSIKAKRAQEVGLDFQQHFLPANTSENRIIALIKQLNNNPKIHAILVQLPLPKHLNTNKIIASLNTAKDADGIHPDHLKLLKQTHSSPILPATTGAIAAILNYLNIDLTNKSVAIVGKSRIVGLPTYYYLKNKVNQINLYDKHTFWLKSKTKQADILIVAIGQPKFITDQYVKPDAIIIDVGINKLADQTVGDVDFDNVKNKTRAITPVPGGVGPITVAILLQNTLKLYEKTKKRK